MLIRSPQVSYQTSFPTDENPLSESGLWQHQDVLLTPCKVVGGRAFGTQTGSGGFDDSNDYLLGYGPNHEVEGICYLNPSLSGAAFREVEILLRWQDDLPVRSTAYGDTHANGYEINIGHDGSYMNLGRFKGAALVVAPGDFTAPVPATGDKFRARIIDQTITCWWTPVATGVESQLFQFTDSDAGLKIVKGHPGIGFYFETLGGGANTDFGFESMIARRC